MMIAMLIASPAWAQPRRVVLGASGDVLFHTRVVAVGRARGFDHLFAALRPHVAAGEIAFVNLETPLSELRTPGRGNPPILGAPAEAGRALAQLGVDVVSLANNHAFDQRDAGLLDTMQAVRAAGMQQVGAAQSAGDAPGPLVIERDGLRIAFVAFTMDLNGFPPRRRAAARVGEWDERLARRLVERARESADVVVASMHWGLAYRHEHRSEQRAAAQALVRAGADVVLGHGPHVLQPVERVPSSRGEAVIAYSLGNFVSNQGYEYVRGGRGRGIEPPLWLPATRDGVWLRIALQIDGGRVQVQAIEGVPLWTENNYPRERDHHEDANIRVVPLSSVEDEALRAERRRAIGGALGSHVHLLD